MNSGTPKIKEGKAVPEPRFFTAHKILLSAHYWHPRGRQPRSLPNKKSISSNTKSALSNLYSCFASEWSPVWSVRRPLGDRLLVDGLLETDRPTKLK